MTNIERIQAELVAVQKKRERTRQRLRELGTEEDAIRQKLRKAILRTCCGQSFRTAVRLEQYEIGTEAVLLDVKRTRCVVRFTADNEEWSIPMEAIAVDFDNHCLKNLTKSENQITAMLR